MAAPGKLKARDAGARLRLIEATAQIMRDEGYAAATSRRVAAVAGVKPALVYYYFDTMDDLFLAVLRAGAEISLAEMRKALTEDNPLRALWVINSDPRRTGLNTEFMAMANHRKVIGAELKAYAERVRDIETAAVTVALRTHGVDLEDYPPVVVSMLQRDRHRCHRRARSDARVPRTLPGPVRRRHAVNAEAVTPHPGHFSMLPASTVMGRPVT
jgi:AcrR family transcriptional regulator